MLSKHGLEITCAKTRIDLDPQPELYSGEGCFGGLDSGVARDGGTRGEISWCHPFSVQK